MQLQPVYQTQWIQRKHTQTHTHTHTMSSREKLHSLFSISFFANISQQFMLFFFFLSTFGLLFFFNQVIYFYFSRSLQHTRIMELAQPLTKTLWPIFSFAEHFILFSCTGKKESKFNLFNKMIKELTDVMRRTFGCGFFYVH